MAYYDDGDHSANSTSRRSNSYYDDDIENRSTPKIKSDRSIAVAGDILYETTGENSYTIATTLKLIKDETTVQFYEHAVVMRYKSQICCFPPQKGMIVIPRFKIVNATTGLGPKRLFIWLLLAIAGLAVLILGVTVFNYYGKVSATGVLFAVIGAIAAVFGIVMFSVTLCFPKDYFYCLEVATGNGGWFGKTMATTRYQCPSPRRADERFLYQYVYGTLERTKDMNAIHAFAHLHRTALMQPMRPGLPPYLEGSVPGAIPQIMKDVGRDLPKTVSPPPRQRKNATPGKRDGGGNRNNAQRDGSRSNTRPSGSPRSRADNFEEEREVPRPPGEYEEV